MVLRKHKERAIIYARNSSDLQSRYSVVDQIRICKEYCRKKGYEVVEIYTDVDVSGASMARQGIQSVLSNTHKCDVVVCESLSRLSRDQADIATIHKQLSFDQITIDTVEEGLIDELHIGLKGTMNHLFLNQLREQTRRGLMGRVAAGKSAGGKTYGYDIPIELNLDKTLRKGEMTINQFESNIVISIFNKFVFENKSAKTIAHELNKQKIPAPSGGEWGASTISGNRRRGSGILNNELYIGRRIYNRLTYRKHPYTGKRQSRLNPEEAWIISDVPDLAIIEKDLWELCKSKQSKLSTLAPGAAKRKRPTHLLSDLVKCPCCGGGMSMRNKKLYGCSRATYKGTCDNKATIKREELENSILRSLKSEIFSEATFDTFVDAYLHQIDSLNKELNKENGADEIERRKLVKQKTRLIESIKSGIPAEYLKDELINLEQNLSQLAPKPKVDSFVPKTRNELKTSFVELSQDITGAELTGETKEKLRAMIDKVVVSVGEFKEIELHVNFTSFALDKKKRLTINSESDHVVAGAGFEPTTFGL